MGLPEALCLQLCGYRTTSKWFAEQDVLGVSFGTGGREMRVDTWQNKL
jgi:hypothetical protein